MRPLLAMEGVVKRYPLPGLLGTMGGRAAPALDGVRLEVRAGEVVGLIGESGSGKTTMARAALGLLSFEAGEVELLGTPLPRRVTPWGTIPRGCQLLLQHPDSSLNPRLTVEELLLESARVHMPESPPLDTVQEVAAKVGIRHRLHGRPRQLSGGEKRRVGIARLLLADPLLTAADEPTAGLDAALKAEIMDLLLAGRGPDRGYLIISHDLYVVRRSCQRVVVLYAGQVVEEVPTGTLGHAHHHPYTTALLSSAGMISDPVGWGRRATGLQGRGCPCVGACPRAVPRCSEEPPALRPVMERGISPHQLACHVVKDR